MPSPRQNVEADALVPLPRFVTGRFPDTSLARFTAVPALQVSDAVRRMIPVPLSPSTAARSFARASVMLPLVVIGPPLTVMPAAGCVRLTLVTLPLPLAVLAIVTTPAPPVPVVVSVMLLPSTSCTDPPVADSVTVWLVASDVLAIV